MEVPWQGLLAAFDHVIAKEMPVGGTVVPVDEFFEIHGFKGPIWVMRCAGELLDMPPVMLLNGMETTSFQVEAK